VSTFTLTALLGRKKRTSTIEAESRMEALHLATKHVLDRAAKEQAGPWAYGIVVLTDEDGYPLHTMDAGR